ncbi:MAG: penicillin acylase family protein [Anaerolineae bacterium]|nr:penicillin acylase family protein [Anaerolineae bacterium]
MNRLARIGLILIGILLVFVLVIVVSGSYAVKRPFPVTKGSHNLNGLQDEVTVYRDSFGIPHIYANNQADLFFAQGYVTAQDRFWQMEFWRHIGMGRISEIAGEATIGQDKFIRTMGWNRMAQDYIDYYEQEAPEFMDVLDAYSAGVNAYIDENRDNLPLQIQILGLVNEPWEIEPWQPVHTVAWGIVMADNLSGNWSEELTRARLYQELDQETVDVLWPGYPYENRPVIAPTEDQVNLQARVKAPVDFANNIDWQTVNTTLVGQPPTTALASGYDPNIGSNNWVISGDHTDTGMPLLANDPHLSVQMPAIWYEIGLHAPDFNVRGFSFAGVPGVIIGHNEHIAWGVTNVGPDTQDLYIEKRNPDNPNQVEFMGAWEDMEIIEETIKVNGGEDVVLPVFFTRHGPVINDLVDGDLTDTLAFRWTAQEPSRILQSVILLNRAQNFEEFREALSYWDTPSQNVVYADTEGNIGYQTPGLMPIRKNGDGRTPVPGWTGEYEWEGFVPYDELPTLYNPERGFIVTANHALVDEDYAHFLSYDWADGDRGLRIETMISDQLAVDGKISAADIAAIQFDSKSLPAETWVPLLMQLESDDPQIQAAQAYLSDWDFQERIDSVPASLFELFYARLFQNVLADEIGEENVETIEGQDIFMYELASDLESAWWDDVNTPEAETAVAIMERSLSEAITWLAENVGGDMENWTWGSLHTITFADGILGASGVAPIEAIFNRGAYPLDGGSDLVNATSWQRSEPAVVIWYPSMRMIVDMGDYEASQSVIPSGQSGHAYSPNYDDQIPLWLNGEYHPMVWSQEAVQATTINTLYLRPGN